MWKRNSSGFLTLVFLFKERSHLCTFNYKSELHVHCTVSRLYFCQCTHRCSSARSPSHSAVPRRDSNRNIFVCLAEMRLHRLNMEVLQISKTKVYLGSMSRDMHSYTHWLRPRNRQSPRIWTRMRGRHWSAKTDDISL